MVVMSKRSRVVVVYKTRNGWSRRGPLVAKSTTKLHGNTTAARRRVQDSRTPCMCSHLCTGAKKSCNIGEKGGAKRLVASHHSLGSLFSFIQAVASSARAAVGHGLFQLLLYFVESLFRFLRLWFCLSVIVVVCKNGGRTLQDYQTHHHAK